MQELASRIDTLVETYSGAQIDATPAPATSQAKPSTKSAVSAQAGANPVVRPPESNPSASLPRTPLPRVSQPSANALGAQPPRPGSGNRGHRVTQKESLLDQLRAAKIMIIDDEEANVRVAARHLRDAGVKDIITVTKSELAIKAIRTEMPDAILLDICMPKVSGIDILMVMRCEPHLARIPSIVLTATTNRDVKRRALDLGAHDFLTKPLDPNDLVPRLRNAVVTKKYIDHIDNEKATLAQLVHRRTSELESSRQQLILSLARAAEHRDNETGNHVIRVGRFAGIIARQLGWDESQVAMLEQAAQLHDVGKIGVPDSILFKPGKLEPREYDIMKRHCAWGKKIIEPFSGSEFQALKAHARMGESILHIRSSPMLMMASRIAQTHHENWDGTGYPLGLAGNDIPLEGRITSVADVFDALSSKRPYKDPFPREKCMDILNEQRGTKFDPDVLDAFMAQTEEIVKIQIELMDEDEMDVMHHDFG